MYQALPCVRQPTLSRRSLGTRSSHRNAEERPDPGGGMQGKCGARTPRCPRPRPSPRPGPIGGVRVGGGWWPGRGSRTRRSAQSRVPTLRLGTQTPVSSTESPDCESRPHIRAPGLQVLGSLSVPPNSDPQILIALPDPRRPDPRPHPQTRNRGPHPRLAMSCLGLWLLGALWLQGECWAWGSGRDQPGEGWSAGLHSRCALGWSLEVTQRGGPPLWTD